MVREISRRRALQVVALGAAATVAGGVGTWRSLVAPLISGDGTEPGRPLREPQVMASDGWALAVALRAGSGVVLAGRRTEALGYNGTSPGPTLKVRPGDTLRVRLANELAAPTNLHTHGLHVSPEGRGDNVFRVVEPGDVTEYEYRIPPDHPAGTFWYHPHHHGTVADQVFGGLFGALLVTDAKEPQVARDRVLMVSDITLTQQGEVAGVGPPQRMMGREGTLVLVNGQLRPRIDVAAGSVERWRVVNACTSRFLRLQLDGQTVGLLGYDGQALHHPEEQGTVVLAPGNRADLLVHPQEPGDFTLRTLAFDRGSVGTMSGGQGASAEAELARMHVQDTAASSPAPSGPATDFGARLPDLRHAPIDRSRTITFTMGMGMGMGMGVGGMSFGFDGLEFDPGRVDQSIRLGTVEEWTIGNDTPMDHPFHLHVWPMQVMNGADVSPSTVPDWRDVVIVPARSRVRVRIRFSDFAGRTVYHCHILDHEDLGMMAQVEASA